MVKQILMLMFLGTMFSAQNHTRKSHRVKLEFVKFGIKLEFMIIFSKNVFFVH